MPRITLRSTPRVTQSNIRKALTKSLELRQPEFRLRRVGDRIVGSIISDTFRGHRDMKRINEIWDALEDAFGPTAVKRVGMLLAYTPDEWYFDDDIDGKPRRNT